MNDDAAEAKLGGFISEIRDNHQGDVERQIGDCLAVVEIEDDGN